MNGKQAIFLDNSSLTLAEFDTIDQLEGILQQFLGLKVDRCYINKSRSIEEFAGPGTLLVSCAPPNTVGELMDDVNLVGSFIYDLSGRHYFSGKVALVKEFINTDGELRLTGFVDLTEKSDLILRIGAIGKEMLDALDEIQKPPVFYH